MEIIYFDLGIRIDDPPSKSMDEPLTEIERVALKRVGLLEKVEEGGVGYMRDCTGNHFLVVLNKAKKPDAEESGLYMLDIDLLGR